jgi:hypothetical protein
MVQWSRGAGSGRMKMAKLRAACSRHKYALDPLPARGVYRLIDLDIGHAVINEDRRSPAFNVDQALRYLRALERSADPSS